MNKIIGTLIIAVLLVGGGMRAEHWRMEAKIAAANKKYQDLKEEKQHEINILTQNFTNDLDTISRERDAALSRLRDRPDRLPESARADCKGTSGAELSAQDAEFLTRESARADRLREALNICYRYADTLQE